MFNLQNTFEGDIFVDITRLGEVARGKCYNTIDGALLKFGQVIRSICLVTAPSFDLSLHYYVYQLCTWRTVTVTLIFVAVAWGTD